MAFKFVSLTGNNGNSGTEASPYQTVVFGISQIGAGDTLFVRAGTYDEGISSVPSGISWSNFVRMAAYPGETVWLKPLVDFTGNPGECVRINANSSYVEFDAINMDGRNMVYGTCDIITTATLDPHHFRFKNAEHIGRTTANPGSTYAHWCLGVGGHETTVVGGNEIINMTLHGGGRPGTALEDNGYAIYAAGPNNLIELCRCYDNKGYGIHIYNGAGAAPSNNIVRNNKIYDMTRASLSGQIAGILVDGSTNQIYNNLIYNISALGEGEGIQVFGSGTGNKLYNNTIYNCPLRGIRVGTSAVNCEIKNNIIRNSGTPNIQDGGIGTVLLTNVTAADPLFVNAAAGDFHVTVGSPAIDAGTTLAIVTTDFDLISRPKGSAYDIGAYERDVPPLVTRGRVAFAEAECPSISADKKISELVAASSALAADELPVNEAGFSKKITVAQLQTAIGGGPTLITGATGAVASQAAPSVTLHALAANNADVTTTAVVNQLNATGAGLGWWLAEYFIHWQSSTTTTGINFTVGHSGVVSPLMAHRFDAIGSTTALATVGIAHQTIDEGVVGNLPSTWASNTDAGSLGPNAGVTTANSTEFSIIRALFKVTTSGDIRLNMGSEVGGSAVRVMAGTCARYTRLS